MSKKQKNAIKKTLIDYTARFAVCLSVGVFFGQWILR